MIYICWVIILSYTYFFFNRQFYWQIHGAAMGSLVSMKGCDLYMKVEERAITTICHHPYWWNRYVADTFNKEHAHEFTHHLKT